MKKALTLFVFILLTEWGFSYAGSVQVAVPYQIKLNSAQSIVNAVNSALSADKIALQNLATTVAQVEANLNRYKAARYVIQPVLASRGNIYILAGSLVGSALFDYLIDYIEQQKNQYLSSLPPPDCEYLTDYPCQYYPMDTCNPSKANGYSLPVKVITGWRNNGTGGCFPITETKYVPLPPGSCLNTPLVSSVPNANIVQEVDRWYQGSAPTDYLSCRNQPKKDPPPFIFPPITMDQVQNLIPSGDFTSSLNFPDDATIKTPQDISPPLISPDGSTIYDIPKYSPDGIFSPDVSNPDNYVPDIPLNDSSIKISYNISNPTTNQTYNYNDHATSVDNSNDAYFPSDANLDTNIDNPEKKDIQGLITSFIDVVKSRFQFDSSCSGGSCSFQIDVFGSSATIDFCQFQGLFEMIGSVILVFAYFYAFFIVVKGD